MTKVKHSPVTWLECKLVIARRSPLEESFLFLGRSKASSSLWWRNIYFFGLKHFIRLTQNSKSSKKFESELKTSIVLWNSERQHNIAFGFLLLHQNFNFPRFHLHISRILHDLIFFPVINWLLTNKGHWYGMFAQNRFPFLKQSIVAVTYLLGSHFPCSLQQVDSSSHAKWRFLSMVKWLTDNPEETVYFLCYLLGPYMKYPSHIGTPYN